ncbi:MAG: hypothetical protein GX801_03055 [Fibrobacter sp.]|nr:hypothetical protein [Fibrobacter sp.]
MEILVDFFKVHYNFAAIAIIIALIALFKLHKGNIKGFAIYLAVFLVYNIGLKSLVNHNPQWFNDAMESFAEFDFVDWIWGGNVVSKSVKSSEDRANPK